MEKFVVQDHLDALCLNVNKCRLNNDYCDVNFCVQEKTFKCHRLILGAVSEYFHTMFNGYYKESSESVITLEEIEADTFEMVLQFIYTGDVSLSTINWYKLLYASDFYKLPGLEKACAQYLTKNSLLGLSENNVPELFSFLHQTGKKEIIEILDLNIFNNFYEFSKLPEFLQISFLDLARILKLINKLYKPLNHDVFYKAVVNWTKHAVCDSPEDRGNLFDKLVSHISLGKLSSEYFVHMSKQHFENSISAYPEITHSKIEGSVQQRTHAFVKTYSPDWESHLLSIFTLYLKDEFEWIYSYEFKYSSSQNCLRTTQLDNYLYCLSYSHVYKKEKEMKNASSTQNFIMSSSISLLADSYLVPPPIIVRAFDLCGMGQSIYLYNKDIYESLIKNNQSAASFDEEELAHGIYLYNREIDKWLPTPALKQKFGFAGMTCDEQMVYLIGGCYSNKYAQCYDPRTKQWQALPKTSTKFENTTCCVSDGKIYVCDQRNPRIAEVYDPAAAKWSKTPGVPYYAGNVPYYADNVPYYADNVPYYADNSFGCEILENERGNVVMYGTYYTEANTSQVFFLTLANDEWYDNTASLQAAIQRSALQYKSHPRVLNMATYKPFGL